MRGVVAFAGLWVPLVLAWIPSPLPEFPSARLQPRCLSSNSEAEHSHTAERAGELPNGEPAALQYGVTAGGGDPFFSCDTRVIFGVNALEIGVAELHGTGLRRPLVVTGWNQARADPLVWELYPRGFQIGWHSVVSEPTFHDIIDGAKAALKHEADCVIAMGGGSAIDAAKLIAAIAYAPGGNHGEAISQLMGPRPLGAVNAAPAVVGPPIPVVTVPLVSGTGAEVTPMALALPDAFAPARVTAGLAGSSTPRLPAPFMALVEPRLQLRLPLHETWTRAFTALAGCLEAQAAGAGFVPDLLAEQGMRRIADCLTRSLPPAAAGYHEREDVAIASVSAGLVRRRDGWSQLHVLAVAVAGGCGVPYALATARLLPAVLVAQAAGLEDAAAATAIADASVEDDEEEESAAVISDGGSFGEEGFYGEVLQPPNFVDVGAPRRRPRSGDASASIELLKLTRASRVVTGQADASVEDLGYWLRDRLYEKNVPQLASVGISVADIPSVVDTALQVAAREGGRSGRFLDRQHLEALLEAELAAGAGASSAAVRSVPLTSLT